MGDTFTSQKQFKSFVPDSRECDIVSEYLKLNKVFGVKAMNMYDKLFEFILYQFKPELKLKSDEHKELNEFATQLKKSSLKPEETLVIFRKVGKYLDISFEELTKHTTELHQLLFWSPGLALKKLFEDFFKNGYGTSYLEEYFKDASKCKKLIEAGKQDLNKSFSELEPCLISFLINDNIKQHRIITAANVELNEKLALTPVEFWIDLVIEEGIENKLKGIDVEFKNYLINLTKLSKFWDVYKSQRVDSKFVGNRSLTGGEQVSENDLFNIYAGNYSLVPRISAHNVSIEESNKLICNWDNFNKLSQRQQMETRAFLLANINKVNNYIQRASEKIYGILSKTKNIKNYSQLLSSYVRSKSFYGNSDTSNIINLQQIINTRMNNCNFKTVADVMEFVVHQYVPLLQNYKKSSSYNRVINNLLLNSVPLSVIGVAEYLPDPEVKSETKYVERVVEKVIEKPAKTEIKYVDRYVDRYIEKPVVVYQNLTGGFEEPKEENNSTDEYVNSLTKFQQDFNKTFTMNWRSILNKLSNIQEHQIRNSSQFDANILTKFEKIMINSPKTTYYLSGAYKARDFNRDYTIAVGGLLKSIIESKNPLLQQFVEPLKNIYDLCKDCKEKLRAIKNKYLQSTRSISDFAFTDLSGVKIESDIKQDEIILLKDSCNRIARLYDECRSSVHSQENSSEMLKKYLNTRKDKNKIIDDYFESVADELKRTLTQYSSDYSGNQKLIEEFRDIVSKRLLINQETQKCYKWLNNNLDTMLASNRLHQLKNSTLSIDVLHKIENAYLEFNNYTKANETVKLTQKLAKATSNPEKFRSYFKVCKLAKKWIENMDLIGYIERIYKELGISSPDFNWGVFKDKLIVFMITDMIRVDVFVPHELKANIYDNQFDLLNMIEINGNRERIVHNARDGVYHNHVINKTGNELIYDEDDNFDAALFNKRMNLLKWVNNVANDDKKPDGDIDIANNGEHDINWQPIMACKNDVGDIKLFVYGYSIRNFVSNYYPLLKTLPVHTFKGIITPIVEVIDKYILQRYNGSIPINQTNTALMMKGGDKVKGSSMFDVIEPHEIVDDKVIPEAIEFYLSGYHILKFYVKLLSTLNNNVSIKFFKVSSLYKLKALFGAQMDIASDSDLKTMISVFNEIWSSFTETNEKIKTKKAIDILIAEVNSCIIYNTSEDMMLFKDSLENLDTINLFNFNFEQLHDILSRSINTISQAIGQLSPSSISSIETLIKDTTSKITKLPENMRIGALKNLFVRNEHEDNSEYYNFCELCISPLAVTIAYYKIAFELIVGETGRYSGVDKNSHAEAQAFFNTYFAGLNTRTDNDILPEFVNTVSGKTQLLITIPEIIIANKHLIENPNPENVRNFFRKMVEGIYGEYSKDIDQCIHNILNYPGYNDEKLVTIKEQLHDAFKQQYEESLEYIRNDDNIGVLIERCRVFNVPINYIPCLDEDLTTRLFRDINDLKYSFKTQLIDERSMTNYRSKQDISFTKFVVMALASQQPDLFLPQSFIQLLENSPLNGITFANIDPLGFIKTSDIVKTRNIEEIFGHTPLTNFIIYRSHTELAISKTSTNMINKYYATSLISIIPFILDVMFRSLNIIKDNFNYNCNCYIEKYVDAKLEITILSQILIKLYNELLPLSNNIQFKDSMDLKTTHSITEILYDFQADNIALKSEKTFSDYEWINPLVNNNVGINYENYDRLELYKNKYIKPIGDELFATQFETILKQMAKIVSNKLILGLQYPEQRTLNIGNKAISVLRGGLHNYNVDAIVDMIATNPRVLELVGHIGLTTENLRNMFNHLFTHDYGNILNGINIVNMPNEVHYSYRGNIIYSLEHRIKRDKSREMLLNEIKKLFNVGIDNFSADKLSSVNQANGVRNTLDSMIGLFNIDNADLEHLNKFYAAAVITTIFNTLRRFSNINKDVKVNNANNVNGNFQNIGVCGGLVLNNLDMASNHVNELDNNRYIFANNLFDDDNLKNEIIHFNDDDGRLNQTIADIILRYINGFIGDDGQRNIHDPNIDEISNTITTALNAINALNTNFKNKKIITEYILNLTWNEHSVDKLIEQFKAGYNLGYYMFISTMVILGSINLNAGNFVLNDNIANITNLFDSQISNIEGFAVSIANVLSQHFFDNPSVSSVSNPVENSLFSYYGGNVIEDVNREDIKSNEGMSKLCMLLVGDIYKESLEKDPLSMFVNYSKINTEIDHNVIVNNNIINAGYLSAYGLPTLQGISDYFPNSREIATQHQKGDMFNDIYDYWLGARIMVGANSLITCGKDEGNDVIRTGFTSVHLGSKLMPPVGLYDIAPTFISLQSRFTQVGITAQYCINARNVDINEALTIATSHVNQKNNHGVFNANFKVTPQRNPNVLQDHANLKYIYGQNLDMCGNCYPLNIGYKDENKIGVNTGTDFFDVALTPNIDFVTDNDDRYAGGQADLTYMAIDQADNYKKYRDRMRLNREVTLYHLGVLYGKYQKEIREDPKIKIWNNYTRLLNRIANDHNHQLINATTITNCSALFDSNNNIIREFGFTKNDFVGERLILKELVSYDSLCENFLISASPILGQYRCLYKISKQQNDYTALYVTHFKDETGEYTCFINGRPIALSMDYGEDLNENIKMAMLYLWLCKSKNSGSFVSTNKSSLIQIVAEKLHVDILTGDEDVDLTNLNKINKALYSIDAYGQNQQFTKFTPFISCHNIVIIKNINKNPILIKGFGENASEYNSNIAENTYKITNALIGGNVPDDLSNSLLAGVNNFDTCTQLILGHQSATPNDDNIEGEINLNNLNDIANLDVNAEGAVIRPVIIGTGLHFAIQQYEERRNANAANGDTLNAVGVNVLPELSNKAAVGNSCIEADIVKNVIKYAISVGEKIKNMTNGDINIIRKNIGKVFDDIEHNKVDSQNIKEVLLNSYLCGMPIYSGDKNSLKEWRRLGRLFKIDKLKTLVHNNIITNSQINAYYSPIPLVSDLYKLKIVNKFDSKKERFVGGDSNTAKTINALPVNIPHEINVGDVTDQQIITPAAGDVNNNIGILRISNAVSKGHAIHTFVKACLQRLPKDRTIRGGNSSMHTNKLKHINNIVFNNNWLNNFEASMIIGPSSKFFEYNKQITNENIGLASTFVNLISHDTSFEPYILKCVDYDQHQHTGIAAIQHNPDYYAIDPLAYKLYQFDGKATNANNIYSLTRKYTVFDLPMHQISYDANNNNYLFNMHGDAQHRQWSFRTLNEYINGIMGLIGMKKLINDRHISYGNPEVAFNIEKMIAPKAVKNINYFDNQSIKKYKNDVFTILSNTLLKNEVNVDNMINRTNVGFNPSMFGGYNLFSDNLISDISKDLIKSYYFDANKQPIYSKLMPGSFNANMDITNLIVSYYKKQMLAFNPIFDKYLYVEILYNSAVLDNFITKMLQTFDAEIANHGNDQLAQSLRYLRNLFNIRTNRSYIDYEPGQYRRGINGVEFNNEGLANGFDRNTIRNDIIDPNIYENIKYTPSEISKGLNEIYRYVNELRLDVHPEKRGVGDVLYSMASKILELDKYNIFIGTLAKVIKSLQFRDNNLNADITYSKHNDVDLTPVIGLQH